MTVTVSALVAMVAAARAMVAAARAMVVAAREAVAMVAARAAAATTKAQGYTAGTYRYRRSSASVLAPLNSRPRPQRCSRHYLRRCMSCTAWGHKLRRHLGCI